jgi:hypothetical protein
MFGGRETIYGFCGVDDSEERQDLTQRSPRYERRVCGEKRALQKKSVLFEIEEDIHDFPGGIGLQIVADGVVVHRDFAKDSFVMMLKLGQ